MRIQHSLRQFNFYPKAFITVITKHTKHTNCIFVQKASSILNHFIEVLINTQQTFSIRPV